MHLSIISNDEAINDTSIVTVTFNEYTIFIVHACVQSIQTTPTVKTLNRILLKKRTKKQMTHDNPCKLSMSVKAEKQ